MKLNLDRPLAVFDIESTGTNRRTDRIIDLAVVKLLPNGKRETHHFRVNPEMPIPPDSTKIHGITDEDVKGKPTFKQEAAKIAAVLEGCDLGGYNILGFDIPVLTEEFARAGMEFDLDDRRVLDAQRIYHKREPRDLTAALAYYCNEMHLGAHDALGDVEAVLRVLDGQLARYSDLPRDLDGLDAYCNPKDPSWVDRAGKLKWAGGEAVLNFGKKQGQKLRDIAKTDPGFLEWMLKGDFPRDTKAIIRDALKGKFPAPTPKPDGEAPANA